MNHQRYSTSSLSDCDSESAECESISSTHSSCYDEEEVEEVGSDSATIGPNTKEASWPSSTPEDIRSEAAPAVSINPHIEDSGTEECRTFTRGEATTSNDRRPDEISLQLDGWFSSLIHMSADVVYDTVLAEVCGGGGHEQILSDLEEHGAKTLKVLHRRADRTALALGDAADAGVHKVIHIAAGDDLYGFADFRTMRRREHLQTNAGQVKGTGHNHTRSRGRSRSSSRTWVGRRSLSRDKSVSPRSYPPVMSRRRESAHSTTSRKSGMLETRDGPAETVGPKALASAHCTTSRRSGMLDTRDGPAKTVRPKALAPERQMALTDEATQPSSAAKRLNLRFWTRGKNKGVIKATSEAGRTYEL